MKLLLDQYDIHHFSTHGEPKAAMAKRFNRTLKELAYKYMTAHDTLKYLDALPELLARYNQRIHSSIDMAQADVTHHNDEVVWRQLLKPSVPYNRAISQEPSSCWEKKRDEGLSEPRACGRKACTRLNKLKYKGRGPKRQVLVNWQGVAPDYQTWIPAET